MKLPIIAVFSIAVAFGQSKKQIDSVNALPYNVKINLASTLADKYLQYAEAAARIDYPKGQADSYANAALLLYYRGKYEPAVGYRQKALRIYESIGEREMVAHEYGELGYSMKRRNMKMAQHYMQKAISIGEEENFTFRLCGIYDNYGVLKEMQNQLDSALLFYNKSLALKRELNDSIGIPYSLSNIAGVHVIRREFAKAAPYYDRILSIRKKRNDKVGLTETYANIAKMHADAGELSRSVENYEKAISLARETGYIDYAARLYRDLSDVYERTGDAGKAFEAFKRHSVFKDSVVNKETNARLAELEVEFDTERKEKLLLQREGEIREQQLLLAGVSAVAILIGVVALLIYRQQRLKQLQMQQEHELKSAIVQIESQNKLQDQRLAISRDLHDNIGSQLTFIISSVENIKYGFGIENTKLEGKLETISSFARDTIVELRDTIWAMNHSEISFDDLKGRILNFIEKARESTPDTRFEMSIDPALSEVKLTSVEGMNLYRTLQEAVNNAVKYARARNISVSIAKDGVLARIVISDNGSGFDPQSAKDGNGLRNMRKRMADIGASFQIESTLGGGTVITLIKPLKAKA